MPSRKNPPPPPQKTRQSIRRIEGWAGEALARLDPSGGMHDALARSSMLRRQAAFLTLALVEQEGMASVATRFRESFGEEVAEDAAVIRSGIEQPAQEFLQAALGHVPDGLLVALVGIGPKAMAHPKSYLKLIELLNGQHGERKMQFVYEAEHIDGAIIDAFIGIDPDIPSPPIETISSMQDVVRKKED